MRGKEYSSRQVGTEIWNKMMQMRLTERPAGLSAVGRGIGASLAILVLAGLIPVLAFAGFVVYRFTEQYQDGVRERLISVAQATSIAIDRELNHQIEVLEAIGRSELLDKPNFTDLHSELRSIQAHEGWLGVSLLEADTGRQILNTAMPYGVELPHSIDPESLRDVRISARSRIVGIQPRGTIQLEPFILLRVPVVRNGEVRFVLSLAASPQILNLIMERQRVPADSVVALLDNEMRIAARNRAQNEFIGTRATRTLTDKIEVAEEGLFLALNKEGEPVHTVFRKSTDTGWTIAIGIPSSIIDEPLQRTLRVIGGIGIVLVASGIGLATFVGHTIARRRSAEAAFELAQVELANQERRILITAKEEAERESLANSKSLLLAEAKLHQAQKLESIGQLTGGLAHDFNNLLLVIIGNAEIIASLTSDSDELHRTADMILAAAERGAELTHRLLAFARRQTLEPHEIDLNHLIGSMGEMMKRTLGEQVEIKMDLGLDLLPVMADPVQVESALLNLAINARDAMPNGGRLQIETANVELNADFDGSDEMKTGSYVLIAVSDTGTGMPPDVISRAFEPFFTTKEVGRGSGLGLSMIYGFIKQTGGFVRILSEVGQGTTVRLYLPPARAP